MCTCFIETECTTREYVYETNNFLFWSACTKENQRTVRIHYTKDYGKDPLIRKHEVAYNIVRWKNRNAFFKIYPKNN